MAEAKEWSLLVREGNRPAQQAGRASLGTAVVWDGTFGPGTQPSLPAQCPLAACSEEQGPCQNPLLLKGQNLVGGHGQKGGSKPSKAPGRQEWTEARGSRQAAQRTASGHRKGRTVADPGPYLSRGAPPSSCSYSPGLRATLGAMGL